MNEQNYLSIYAKSFNWAGFFLPKQVYSDCSNLYDFCRYIDNIADEKGDLDTKLKNFNACLLYTSPSPRDPKTSRMPSSA